MILILNLKPRYILWILLFLCFLFVATVGGGRLVSAQTETTQTLSVSPTLIQLSATPEQVWQSEIRVINVNEYDLTLYPQVVNFAPKGETGQGDFIPVFENETSGQTLAEWIDIAPEGIVIPKQKTVAVPFTIRVPANAAPGGHYAAILIGTKSNQNSANQSLVQTAQFVSSLFFVRVAGDVLESGSIREFRTTKSLLQSPDVDFEVRFENTGNVHLQPQGDITIYNMWGEERGTIPINHQTHFGNVLPQSIRKFDFTWKSEESAFDIGQYRAVATLGYGDTTKNFSTSTTFFWIVPYRQIIIFIAVFVALIWFFAFAVKLYVRRMLLLSGIAPHQLPRNGTSFQSAYKRPVTGHDTVEITRYQTVTAPVRSSVKDLLSIVRSKTSYVSRLRDLANFITHNNVFFITILVLCSIGFSAWFIWSRVTVEARPYEVTIANPDAPLTISSEAIYYDTLRANGALPKTSVPELELLKLHMVNVSGELGVAAKLRISLETHGYIVESISSELGRIEDTTTIIYHPDIQAEALALSKRLGGALLSADPTVPNNTLTVYVGTDQITD